MIPKLKNGDLPIQHDSRFKCCITTANGQKVDRVPAWSKFARQNKESLLYEGVFWNPEQKYAWKNERPDKPATLKIYEAHVGMSSEDGKVSTYKEFAESVIPRIKESGYTCIQLMAI